MSQTKILLCLLTWATGVLAKPVFTEIKDHNLAKGIVTPSFQNPIHPTDLSTSANPQFTIKNSGRYYVTNHLNRNHSTAAGTILLISASNVNLDLNGKTIAPSISGSMTGGTAIAVARGKSNVQIGNGFIHSQDSSGNQKISTGIDLYETALSGGSGTSYQIKLQDLQITRCKTSGITANTVNDLTIERCTYNDASSSTAAYGTSLTTINNLIIRNCSFSGNTSSGGAVYGIYMSACTDGIIENTACSANSTSNSTCIGIYATGSSNLQFNNVQCNDNTSSGTNTSGFDLVTSTNCQFNRCVANNNNASVGNTYGFIAQTSSHNCQLNNCQFNGNYISTTDSNVGGATIQGCDTFICRNCQFNGNHSNANSRVNGLFLSGATNSTLRNCQMCDNYNNVNGTAAAASVYGLYMISSSNDNLFEDCLANGNVSNAQSSVTVVGLYTTANTGNIFKNCKTNYNGYNSTNGIAGVVVAGIQFASTETRSQIIGCECTNNYNSSTFGNVRAYGIYFLDTTGPVNCQVRDCNIAYNTASSGRAFGFYDNNGTSTTLLLGNIAIGQGQCLGSTLEDDLQWNGNIEPSSNQNFFFKHAGTGDDPRQMISEVPRQNFGSISTAVVKWQNISVY